MWIQIVNVIWYIHSIAYMEIVFVCQISSSPMLIMKTISLSMNCVVCITEHWISKIYMSYWSTVYHFLVKVCSTEADCTDKDKNSKCDSISGDCNCLPGWKKQAKGLCGMYHRILSLEILFSLLIHFLSFPSKIMRHRQRLHYYGSR